MVVGISTIGWIETGVICGGWVGNGGAGDGVTGGGTSSWWSGEEVVESSGQKIFSRDWITASCSSPTGCKGVWR